jgi:hypothetical protein
MESANAEPATAWFEIQNSRFRIQDLTFSVLRLARRMSKSMRKSKIKEADPADQSVTSSLHHYHFTDHLSPITGSKPALSKLRRGELLSLQY